MQQDNDQQAGRGKRRFILPIVIAAVVVLMVVLHLAGVVGPGSH
jgi:hypothetical protein